MDTMEYATIYQKTINNKIYFGVNETCKQDLFGNMLFEKIEHALSHRQQLIDKCKKNVQLKIEEHKKEIDNQIYNALLNKFLSNFSKLEAGKKRKTLERKYQTDIGIVKLWNYCEKNLNCTQNKTAIQFCNFLKKIKEKEE